MIRPLAAPAADKLIWREATSASHSGDRFLESLENSAFVWFVGFTSPNERCERRPGYLCAMHLLHLARNAVGPLLEVSEPIHVRSVTEDEAGQVEADRRRITEAAKEIAADPQSHSVFVWALRGDKHLRIEVGGGAPIAWFLETLRGKVADEIAAAIQKMSR